MIRKIFVVISLAVLSIGCTERIGERQGNQIDVFPVNYSLAVKVKPNQDKAAQEQVDEFIKQHWSLILNQSVTLTYRTNLGKKWVDNLYQDLLTKGIDGSKLHKVKAQGGFGQRFDFEINAEIHRVMVSVCDYAAVGHYGELHNGCYTDGARWQSMVNPEKNLNLYLDATQTNK